MSWSKNGKLKNDCINVQQTHRFHDFAYSYNPGQNVWDKVLFSRIAAIFARSPLPPPPPPPMQCWTTRRQAFPYEQHCMGGGGGGGGEGRIWPKERLFPCEKLIDGRGSAFCKLVPHNFGQDCRFLRVLYAEICVDATAATYATTLNSPVLPILLIQH